MRNRLFSVIYKKCPDISVSLLLEYYRHVMKLPTQFFDTRQVGEIISRIGDAVKVREVVSGTTLTLLVDTATMFAAFGILCFYSLKLAMLSLLLLPLLGFLIHFINRPLKKAEKETMEEAARLQSHLVESLTGIMTFKAFGAEEYVEFKTEKKLVKLLRNVFRATMWGVSASITGEMIIGVGLALIMWSAGAMVINDSLTLGQMIAFYSILVYLFQPMLRLVMVNQAIQSAVIAAGRLGEILDLEAEFSNQADEVEKISLPAESLCEIQLEGVNFRYGTRAQVLHDISLTIPKCSTVALVGESGSGKTTLAKLLMRFYDPTEGQIQIGGYDARDLRLDSLRSHIGYVDQDCFLFSGTIEENLLLGAQFVTLENVIESLRAAGLESFINSLPNRLQTHIGERGMNLSGGQRQRLAIARALLRNPQILILDEATSNLDSQTEQAIQNTIERLKQHKTVIIIAHRLSTIACADEIIVMEKGRIVEQGTHQQLMLDKGKYCDLWKAQLTHSEVELNGFHSAFAITQEAG